MIEGLLGSIYKERILVFIFCRKKGYAREITRFYEISLTAVINHLNNFEKNGILTTQKQGKTIVYKLNPRYPFISELEALLEKVVSFYPEDLEAKLLYNRRRPRRKDKSI